MKGGECFMKEAVMKVAKIVLPILTVGVTLASNYLADKDLDDKVTKKVSEAVAKAGKES
jgi:hypothetical protein